MKKILVYSLGVFSLFCCEAVKAVEKFEILPDLPESLTYNIQPVQAATVTGGTSAPLVASQSIGAEPNILSVLLSLIFVIVLIYFTGIIYAKLNKVGIKTLKKQQGDFARSQVAVVSTTQLGNNKTLHVVELDGKRMLIGASSSNIQLIKDLGNFNISTSEEEFSHIEIPNIKIPKIEIPKIEIPTINFANLSTKTHKPIDELEKPVEVNEEEKLEDENVQVEKEESQEEILSSLFPAQEMEPEIEPEKSKSEHIVDPDDFALYKKYLN